MRFETMRSKLFTIVFSAVLSFALGAVSAGDGD